MHRSVITWCEEDVQRVSRAQRVRHWWVTCGRQRERRRRGKAQPSMPDSSSIVRGWPRTHAALLATSTPASGALCSIPS